MIRKMWVLFQVWRVWVRFPYWRLGQLIDNGTFDNPIDLFSISDAFLVEVLWCLYRGENPPNVD